MNKRVLIGMLSAFMAISAPWSGYAARSIDSPHLNLGNNGSTENCVFCHNQPDLAPNACVDCHTEPGGPYGTKTENGVTTSPGPIAEMHLEIKCEACHNPHVSGQETLLGDATLIKPFDSRDDAGVASGGEIHMPNNMDEGTAIIVDVLQADLLKTPADACAAAANDPEASNPTCWYTLLDTDDYTLVSRTTAVPYPRIVLGDLSNNAGFNYAAYDNGDGTYSPFTLRVSYLAKGAITGSFTTIGTYDPVADRTVVSGISLAAPFIFPSVDFVRKNGYDQYRGLIMWVDVPVLDELGNPVLDELGNPVNEKLSFEIDEPNAGANSLKVLGEVPWNAIPGFDLRRGQLIAKRVSGDKTKTYSTAAITDLLDVEFPSAAGSTSIFVDTVNATPKGVCQVCHARNNSLKSDGTQIRYWRADGTGADHNRFKSCTECHLHDKGFLVSACNGCHGDPPMQYDTLASPATGSNLAGAHGIHMSSGYNGVACENCHVGTGMYTDLATGQDVIVDEDGLQVGFSSTPYPQGYLTSYEGQNSVGAKYDGTNHTEVTYSATPTSNYLRCSNVYCHSNGQSIRMGCLTSTPSLSPRWDWDGSDPSGDPQNDSVKCNNCHGYNKDKANGLNSGGHAIHVMGFAVPVPCYKCHSSTVSDNGAGGNTITNTANHINGSYEVAGGGLYGSTPISITYDKTVHRCTAITCHGPQDWPVVTGTCPDVCNLQYDDSDMMNDDPLMHWTSTNLDDNTVMVLDTSVDPDRVDPVKALCQGGGYDGAGGTISFNIFDTKLGNFSNPSPLDGTTAKNPDGTVNPVVRTYRENAADTIPALYDIATDPLKPRVWINYSATDSNPHPTVPDPDGDGVAAGISWSGYFAHVIENTDPATTNAHPILEFDVESIVRVDADNCTVTLRDLTIDPDATNTTLASYFQGGHDGTNGAGRIQWLPGHGTTSGQKNIPFTNSTPSNYLISANASGAVGRRVWYQYYVWDNHARNTTANGKQKSYPIYSGYKRITLP